jgi:hypothetical protein
MRQLGYERHLKGAWSYRPSDPPMASLEAEWSLVLKACRAGTVDPAERRPMAMEKLRRPRHHVLNQKRGWELVEWLESCEEPDWRPDMLFLRHVTKHRAAGVDWVVTCDGYWEPPERKGLEIDFAVTSRRLMSPRTWRRVKTAGFWERIRRELRGYGLRPNLRPRLGWGDFDGKKPGYYLATFQRKVPNVEEAAPAGRALMKWSPKST